MRENKQCRQWTINEVIPIRKCRSNQTSPQASFYDFHPKTEISSTYFTSKIRPKRKYGNIHLFAQVLQKQLRAKTITQNFQKSNLSLNQHICFRQGFRGNKVKFQSNKKQRRVEFFQEPPNTTEIRKKTDNHSIRTSPENREECMSSSKRTQKDRSMRPNFNINLNIYRKKFKSKMLSKENSPDKIGFNFSAINPSSTQSKDFTRNTINFTQLSAYNKKIPRQNTAS